MRLWRCKHRIRDRPFAAPLSTFFRQAEIAELHDAGGTDHEVGRLDVKMHHSQCMRMRHSLEHVERNDASDQLRVLRLHCAVIQCPCQRWMRNWPPARGTS